MNDDYLRGRYRQEIIRLTGQYQHQMGQKMTHQDDIKQLIVNYNRRLQKLKEQQALAGLSVDPKILLEIEDIEDIIANLQTELKNFSYKQEAEKGDFAVDPQIIATISGAAMSVLTFFLTKVGEGTAQKAGEEIYDLLKTRFKQKPAAQEALADLEQSPKDKDVQGSLRHQLKKVLSDDPALLAELQQLLEQNDIPAAGTTNINQQAGDNARQIGQVFGDVNF